MHNNYTQGASSSTSPDNYASAQQQHTLSFLPVCSYSFDNPLVVLIFGRRGSGKTTQCKFLADKYNLLYFSSGDLIS